MTTDSYFEFRDEKPCCICGRVFHPRDRKQETCGARSCVNKVCKMKAKATKKLVYCKQCRRKIKGEGREFCSRECYKDWMIDESRRKTPPKHLVCQNSKCKKTLNHIDVAKNGSRRYRFDKKYCDDKCKGEHYTELYATGEWKSNLKVWIDNGKPANDGTKLEGNLNVVEDYLSLYS